MALKKLAILGSTGSIGLSALDVIERAPDRFQVVSLAAANSIEPLAAQAIKHRPLIISVLTQERAAALSELLPPELRARVVHGPQGYEAATLECGADMVLSAMVGAAGLLPTYGAVKAGIDVALANKESLVAGGQAVMAMAAKTGAALLPVDSEHSALFQALCGGRVEEVKTLWLTASGGPFRQMPAAFLVSVTPEQALKHPNWDMGQKISIDSATLMNKGLEVIEAHWLFDQPFSAIKVVIHPQSWVHSMVEYVDGSILAQLGPPDMRLAIAHALAHPQRLDLGLPTLDPLTMGSLSFKPPDPQRFPALALAYAAGEEGGTCPAVLSAANEVAVQAFLDRRLPFMGIVALCEKVLEAHQRQPASDLNLVLEADAWARETATGILEAGGFS